MRAEVLIPLKRDKNDRTVFSLIERFEFQIALLYNKLVYPKAALLKLNNKIFV
jgi:hypothetical protein